MQCLVYSRYLTLVTLKQEEKNVGIDCGLDFRSTRFVDLIRLITIIALAQFYIECMESFLGVGFLA